MLVSQSHGVHTRARQRQDDDKTNVEPVHCYDAFHTRLVGPGVKGIIGMHRFNICLVVVLSLSCSGVKTPWVLHQSQFFGLRLDESNTKWHPKTSMYMYTINEFIKIPTKTLLFNLKCQIASQIVRLSILLPDSVLTPESVNSWWYVNLDCHLFCEHTNLTPNIAPRIKQT